MKEKRRRESLTAGLAHAGPRLTGDEEHEQDRRPRRKDSNKSFSAHDSSDKSREMLDSPPYPALFITVSFTSSRT